MPIHTGFAKDATASQWWEDYAWVRDNRQQLIEDYGECVIVVHEKRVIGHGKTRSDAITNAERQLSLTEVEITPFIYSLYAPFGLRRVVATSEPSKSCLVPKYLLQVLGKEF